MSRILVVEDTPEIVRLVQRSLLLEGYEVEIAMDGRAALAGVRDLSPDLIVLDIMLPDINGIEICKRVRAMESASDLPPTPILMLTALDAVADRVSGLEAGADDYLPKPFAVSEFNARVKALLRRAVAAPVGVGGRPAPGEQLRYEDLSLDSSSRIVSRGERVVRLTAREFDLLHVLMKHPNQVMTHDVLMQRIWGDDFYGESNVLAVTIASVRRELEAGGEDRLLQTVRGVGYVLRTSP